MVPKIITPRSELSPNRRLLDLWLSAKSPHTLRAYTRAIADYAAFVGMQPAIAADQLVAMRSGEAQAQVLGYLDHLHSRGLASATIRLRLSALKSLVQLARLVGLIGWSIEVQGPRSTPYRDTRGPGREPLLKLIKAAAESAAPERDTAILRLLHGSALRRGELVRLDWSDVDTARSRLEIWAKGKTDPIWVPMPSRAAAAIEQLLMVTTGQGPVFTSRSGRRLSGRGVAKILARLSRVAGLTKAARPHGLRHLAITEALDKTNGNVREVARFSRHAKIEVLLLYDDNRRDSAAAIAEMVADE